MTTKTRMAAVLTGAAIACSPAAAASARPADQPPPPSSIAASAAEQYQDLRSADAKDAMPDAAQDLRSADTRDAALGYDPVSVEPKSAVSEPSSGGVDLVSLAIGAAGGGGLALIALGAAGLGTRRHHALRT